jgi:hypothetical protein
MLLLTGGKFGIVLITFVVGWLVPDNNELSAIITEIIAVIMF